MKMVYWSALNELLCITFTGITVGKLGHAYDHGIHLQQLGCLGIICDETCVMHIFTFTLHFSPYAPIGQIHRSYNTLVPHPTMNHFVTEMCTHVHISVTKWCIVGCLPNVLLDLWEVNLSLKWRIQHHLWLTEIFTLWHKTTFTISTKDFLTSCRFLAIHYELIEIVIAG